MDYKKKTTTIITKKNNGTIDFILVHFQGSTALHKCYKAWKILTKKPFQHTSASSKKILIENIKCSVVDPSQVCNAVFEEVGGLENVEAISDFPRNYNQIKYARNKIRKTKKQDVIAELLTLASEKNSCISSLQFNPETSFLVVPLRTINYIFKFYTDLLKPIPITDKHAIKI